ncbi:MAG: rRNA maturation RNase YbeY [Pseudomonadota bacterium]
MTLELDVLRDSDAPDLPGDEDFERWVRRTLADRPVSLVLRIVDAAEGQRLNHEFRGKDGPTNVLSFPAELPEEVVRELPLAPLGDIVLCAPVVADEAKAQGKSAAHHWAHLTVHGVLHLLGHDHQAPVEAEAMEALERRLLAGLGIPDPYVPSS